MNCRAAGFGEKRRQHCEPEERQSRCCGGDIGNGSHRFPLLRAEHRARLHALPVRERHGEHAVFPHLHGRNADAGRAVLSRNFAKIRFRSVREGDDQLPGVVQRYLPDADAVFSVFAVFAVRAVSSGGAGRACGSGRTRSARGSGRSGGPHTGVRIAQPPVAVAADGGRQAGRALRAVRAVFSVNAILAVDAVFSVCSVLPIDTVFTVSAVSAVRSGGFYAGVRVTDPPVPVFTDGRRQTVRAILAVCAILAVRTSGLYAGVGITDPPVSILADDGRQTVRAILTVDAVPSVPSAFTPVSIMPIHQLPFGPTEGVRPSRPSFPSSPVAFTPRDFHVVPLS